LHQNECREQWPLSNLHQVPGQIAAHTAELPLRHAPDKPSAKRGA
jgi:hypothetical protein